MHAELAQEGDIAQLVQPVGVVDHHRVGRACAEGQEFLEGPLDALDIGGDLGVGQQRALLVLVGGIADLGGAAAHDHDRPMAGLLQPAQHHDLNQAADMQAVGSGVEADVGHDDALGRRLVQRLQVGALVNVAALAEHAQEVGAGGGHGGPGA